MNTIEIDDEIDDFFIPIAKIHKILEHLLFFLIPEKQTTLTLRIVTDAGIQILNREFRNKNKPTDVLSFPEIDPGLPVRDLGSVVISKETLSRQAYEMGQNETAEFLRLLVHGVLHLLGYDHEISLNEEERMQKKEDECLEILEKFLDFESSSLTIPETGF